MAGPRYADTERVIWRTLLRPLAPNAKLVYLALRTGPDGTSLPGLVETDAARLVSDTGLSFAQVTEALNQLTIERLVEVDDRYCLVRDFGATPAPKSQTSNKTVLGWWKVFEQLPPASPLLSPFLAVLHGACDFDSEGVAEAWSRTFGGSAQAGAPPDAPRHAPPGGPSDAPPDAPSDAPPGAPSEGASGAPCDAPSASRGRAGACAPARDSEQRTAFSEQQKPDEQENAQAREAERVRRKVETNDASPLYRALHMVSKSPPQSRLMHAVAAVGEHAAAADPAVDATLHAIKFVETYGAWRRCFPHQPAWSPEAISQHATSVQRVMSGEDPMPTPGGRAPPGTGKADMRKGRPVGDWSEPS